MMAFLLFWWATGLIAFLLIETYFILRYNIPNTITEWVTSFILTFFGPLYLIPVVLHITKEKGWHLFKNDKKL